MGEENVKLIQVSSPFFFFFAMMSLFIPFSIFIFPDVDMWTSVGLFFQSCVFILFLVSFEEKEKNTTLPENVPLLLLSFWVMISTVMVFYDSARQKFYNHLNIFGFLNFLTFILFYRLCIEHLTKQKIEKILKFVSYGIMGIIVYSVLQKFDLDQFQNPIGMEKPKLDYLVGTIGNPTHLGGYLAMSLPLFYRNEKKLNFVFACLSWLLIAWTGSSSALLTAVSVTSFYALFFRSRMMTPLIVGITFFFILFVSKGYDFRSASILYLNPMGRIVIWRKVLEVWRQRPIFGVGLGYLRFLNVTDQTHTHWVHAHNEYLHYLLELGLIGLSLIVYCAFHYFKTFFSCVRLPLTVSLASIFVGFLVNSTLNFPSHLWLTSSLAMMSYAFVYVIRNEEEHGYAEKGEQH